jgi:hypothetical protein
LGGQLTIQELEKEIKNNLDEAELHERLYQLQEATIRDIMTKERMHYKNTCGYYKQRCKILENGNEDLHQKIIKLEKEIEKLKGQIK